MLTMTRLRRGAASNTREWNEGDNHNRLIIGAPGSGKSTNNNTDLLGEVGKAFIKYNDWQGENAMGLLSDIVGEYPRVLVDDLSNKDRVIPLPLVSVSDDEDFNVQQRERFAQILGSHVGENINERHIKRYYGSELLIRAWAGLPEDKRVQFTLMRKLYEPWSTLRAYIIEYCEDEEVVSQLKRINSLHEATRLNIMGAAERILMETLGNPAIIRRNQPLTYDIDELIRNKWVWVTIGGASKAAFRLATFMRSAEIIDWMDNVGGIPARIVWEEWQSLNLIQDLQLYSMQTQRKRGIRHTLVGQGLPDDPEVREKTANSCGIRIVNRCDAREIAERGAGMLLGLLDSHKVHHTTSRMVHDGYEERYLGGWTEAQDGAAIQRGSATMVGRYREVEDEHYQSLSEQFLELVAEIQNGLAVGERYVNDNGRTYKEYVPYDRGAFPELQERKLQLWLSRMIHGPMYADPAVEPQVPRVYRSNQGKRSGNGRMRKSSAR